ncbi:MAG: fibronectin type III domain-containing protein, partial [Candidatus Curtissbacteria bacterium]
QGRTLARNGAVTLQSNTINNSCAGSYFGGTAPVTPVSSGNITTPGSGPCPPLTTTPIILEARRTSPTSIFLSWGPYAGINTFIIQYGFTNGSFPFSTSVTGFSTTINDLPPNQPIWVKVAATDDCSIGRYSPAVLAGIGLPNTGVGTDDKNTPWNIIIASGIGASLFLFWAARTCLPARQGKQTS